MTKIQSKTAYASPENLLLAELLRPIIPSQYSGKDIIVAYHPKTQQAKIIKSLATIPTYLDLLKGYKYYVVKDLGKPFKRTDQVFSWGNLNLNHEFIASYEICLTSDSDDTIGLDKHESAKNLVKALHADPAATLTAIIQRHLHQAIDGKEDVFFKEFTGSGYSEDFQKTVSTRIRTELGVPFSIAFKSNLQVSGLLEIDVPPISFNLKDSNGQKLTISTKTLLEIVSYPTAKRLGMDKKENIEKEVATIVEEEIKKTIFDFGYYQLAENFANIEREIKQALEKRIKNFGYEIRTLHTLSNLPILPLVRGLRLELQGKECEFYTKNSVGTVAIEMSLTATIQDYKLIAKWLFPETPDVEAVLKHKLNDICKDLLCTISRHDFVLKFDETVAKKLTKIITQTFAPDAGLDIGVLSIRQIRTEEDERFLRIAGEPPRNFTVNTYALFQDAQGSGETVDFDMAFSVTGFAQDGWNQFAQKDYGFRKDSAQFSISQVREATGVSNPSESDLRAARQKLAIDRELNMIQDRIAALLQDKLSKNTKLSQDTRDSAKHEAIWDEASHYVIKKVANEFGYMIGLTQFSRKASNYDDLYAQDIKRKIEVAESALGHEVNLITQQQESQLNLIKSQHQYTQGVTDAQNDLLRKFNEAPLGAAEDKEYIARKKLLDAAGEEAKRPKEKKSADMIKALFSGSNENENNQQPSGKQDVTAHTKNKEELCD